MRSRWVTVVVPYFSFTIAISLGLSAAWMLSGALIAVGQGLGAQQGLGPHRVDGVGPHRGHDQRSRPTTS